MQVLHTYSAVITQGHISPQKFGEKMWNLSKTIIRSYMQILYSYSDFFTLRRDTFFPKNWGEKPVSCQKTLSCPACRIYLSFFLGGVKNFKILKHRNHRSKQDNIITDINIVCQNKGPSCFHENRKIQRSFQGSFGQVMGPP